MKDPPVDTHKYKEALIELQETVRQELESIQAWCEPVAPDQALGRLTRNDAMQDQQLALHQRERLKNRQTRIDLALKRIEAGTFGICMSCNEPIDPRRLDIAPDSPLCVPCIEKYEAARSRK